jgi:hypothetical protein
LLIRRGATDQRERNMPQISGAVLSKGILGAIAVLVSFGAVQLASGRDLLAPQASASEPGTAVNRAAKADRAAGMAGMAVLTQTISLRLDGLADTSVLVRMPLAHEARSNSAPLLKKSGDGKPTVACEPMVSVLTEVFKQLQPGRCVT